MPPEAKHLLSRMGELVRTLRKQRSWTRRDLAHHARISERFLADVESGRANPSVVKVCDLAGALGTTPAQLLGGARDAGTTSGIVALLGLRGAGKSAVGTALAARLDCPFVELDAEVERSTGLSLAQMFELNGEPYFRRAERAALLELLDAPAAPRVLATGGGIVTERETFELLKARTCTVWLEASPEAHWNRVVAQGDLRPMAGREEAFDALCSILDARRPLYEQARWTIDTTGRDVASISEELARTFSPEFA